MNYVNEFPNLWDGMGKEVGGRGRWMGASGWGTHIHPWLIHVIPKVLKFRKKISNVLVLNSGINPNRP